MYGVNSEQRTDMKKSSQQWHDMTLLCCLMTWTACHQDEKINSQVHQSILQDNFRVTVCELSRSWVTQQDNEVNLQQNIFGDTKFTFWIGQIRNQTCAVNKIWGYEICTSLHSVLLYRVSTFLGTGVVYYIYSSHRRVQIDSLEMEFVLDEPH